MPSWTGVALKTSAVWLISLLLLVIAGLVLLLPNGQLLVNYVSFAASIASLILALVAIFYSIISSEGFFRTVGNIQGLSEDIRSESERVASNSSEFAERSDRLLEQLSQIPGSVDRMAERFEGRFDDLLSSVSARPVEQGETNDKQFFAEIPTFGSTVAVYLLAKAAQAGKEFDITKIFDTASVKDYVQGFITCIASLHVKGIRIEYKKDIFKVVEKGEFDPDYIIETVGERYEKGFVRANAAAIDAYFAALDFEEIEEAE